MELQCMSSGARLDRAVGLLSESTLVLRPTRISTIFLPSLKASFSRGGCLSASVSSSYNCPSGGKTVHGSRGNAWCNGKSVDRRRWTREVMSPSSTEHAVAHKDEEEKEIEDADSSNQSFEWKSNWYAVIPEPDLDRAVPHPFQVLGRKVVIWYDTGSAEWKTFADVCPHRLAPLSEGRIDETGCLQCCYHGWSFNGDGACTRIPQAQDEGPEAKAATKIQVPSFPTTIKQGILFVWPEENGQEKANRTNPPVPPEHELEGWSTVPTFRDMDYGWDTGMENLLDPSHVPVAHHMVNGGALGTRDMAKPILMDMKPVTANGCVAKWGFIGGQLQDLTFVAPNRNTFVFSRNGKIMATTTSYVTPTAPRKCRIIVENGSRHWRLKLKVSGPAWWQIVPRWLDHQKMLNLLDGDESLLHGQERLLRETTNDQVENWSKAFYMSTTADRFVGGFRQWMNRFGGKGVKWAEGVDPKLPPRIEKQEDLLDRYNSHTEHCAVCSKALANFRVARTALFIVAGLLVGIAPLVPFSLRFYRFTLVIVAGISALITWRIQVEWIPMFYYKGYDHSRIP